MFLRCSIWSDNTPDLYHKNTALAFSPIASTDYWNRERKPENKNEIIFNVTDEKDYYRAIIYYISGMTDNYAIDIYNKIIGF